MRKAFEGKKYGFFFHFLSPKDFKDSTPEEWNRYTESFNVKKMAEQFHELKAGYAYITLGQNSGFYCSPNSVFDRVLGPGHCSKRDVPLEFAKELTKYGIDFCLYTTSMAPDKDIPTVLKLRDVPPWYGFPYSTFKCETVQDSKLSYFQNIWNEAHAEWAKRYGSMLKAWWVDGCYFADKLYAHDDEPNGHTLGRALRAGNPDTVVAFNPGVMKPRRNYPGSDEDYTAGETDHPDCNLVCEKFVDGLRYHVLTFAGFGWGTKPLRFTPEQMVSITRAIGDNGGAVTWDLPFTLDGLEESVFAGLKQFAKLYEESFEKVPPFKVIPVEPSLDAEGSLEVITEKPQQIHAEFAGKTFDFQSPGKIVLPKAVGEQHLRITLNGLTKDLRIFCGSVKYDFPAVVKSNFSAWTITRNGEKLHFSAKVHEPVKPVVGKVFWCSSGAEIFFKEECGVESQYFASAADGKLFKCVLGEPPAYLPDAKLVRTAEGYTMEFDLPCPHGNTCLVDIKEHVATADGMKDMCLFGGADSGYKRFELYGTLNLK